MKKIYFLLSVFLVICCNGHCDDLTPQFPIITADYGPRCVTKGSWFHKGIDYAADSGVIINAVESGTINPTEGIRWWGNGGWAIFVDGSHGQWIYAHMFHNPYTLPQVLGNNELRYATLVNPVNINETIQTNVIIFWTGTTNQANKVITSEHLNWWVRNPESQYLF